MEERRTASDVAMATGVRSLCSASCGDVTDKVEILPEKAKRVCKLTATGLADKI